MPLNDYQVYRLLLIPRVILFGAWAVGVIWGISYVQPPPMPMKIGLIGAAVGLAALAATLLLRPRGARPTYIPYLIAITILANLAFPFAMMAIVGDHHTETTTSVTP